MSAVATADRKWPPELPYYLVLSVLAERFEVFSI